MKITLPARSAIAVAYTIFLTYAVVAPNPWWFLGQPGLIAEEQLDQTVNPYWQHLLAFGILAILWWWISLFRRPWVALIFLGGAFYSGLTEYLQQFSPGRSADWGDGIADVCGVVLGILLILPFSRK